MFDIAFAGESQANRRYLYFAQKADVEGYNDVAVVFRSTAKGETGHAHGHLEYMEAVGDPATGLKIGLTSDNLKASIAGETHEYTDMYPGMSARKLLQYLGVEAIVEYPGCCGMPFLEQANLARVAEQAEKISAALISYVDQGYDIVTLTASCGLMFKFEWPLIVPGNETVARLAKATFDIDEYVVEIAKKNGLSPGLKEIEGGVSVHLACHARAQNMGPKAAEMLKLAPGTRVDVIERCSGHGGTFGVLKPTYDVAMKVGRPAARTAATQANAHVVSDCPLAAKHLKQGMRAQDAGKVPSDVAHPIELMAKAYGLVE